MDTGSPGARDTGGCELLDIAVKAVGGFAKLSHFSSPGFHVLKKNRLF